MNNELSKAVKLFIRQPLNNPLSRSQMMEIARIVLPILEQQEKEATPQIDNDGWIEWSGGERPVGKSEVVNVRYRDGEEDTGIAGFQSWKHVQESDDIIAYRLIENDGREG